MNISEPPPFLSDHASFETGSVCSSSAGVRRSAAVARRPLVVLGAAELGEARDQHAVEGAAHRAREQPDTGAVLRVVGRPTHELEGKVGSFTRVREKQLPIADAVRIATEVASALDYAHRKKDPSGKEVKIIHRDVSPSNILCSVQGEVKLSDFGIAAQMMRRILVNHAEGRNAGKRGGERLGIVHPLRRRVSTPDDCNRWPVEKLVPAAVVERRRRVAYRQQRR